MATPFLDGTFQGFLASGAPNAGGSLESYVSGTLTPVVTYSTADLSVPNSTSITLDSTGRATVWLAPGNVYRFIHKTAAGVTLWDRDGFSGSALGTTVSGMLDEVHTATAGQTVFNLATTYVVGGGNLAVYVDGLRLTDSDFTETGATTVTLAAGLSAGQEVMFVIGEQATSVQANWVGYTPGGTGAVSRTAQAKLREFVSVSDFGAVGDGATDDSAAFAAAIAAHDFIFIPAGTYLVNVDLTGIRGKVFYGEGRDKTVLSNVDNDPVFLLAATGSDCKFHVFRDFRIQNRAKATWTTADAFVLTAATGTLENDFHVFQNLEIVSMRNGFRLLKRTIWSSWRDVHVYDSIGDGFYCYTDDNVSALKFDSCRFGQNGGHGLYARKDSGDPLAAWSFSNCTFEKNNLCGVFVEGTSTGIAAWHMSGCYFEENTRTVSAGSTNPRKANIDIRSASCLGLHIDGCNVFGTPLTPDLDWGVYVSSATQSGMLGANRAGVFALGFANIGANWLTLAQTGGTASITKAAGSFSLSELTSESTGSDTFTLTGCTTSPTGVARTVKQRSQVTVYLPTITGTSNTTAATLTGLPAAFIPARTQIVLARVTNNGTTAVGLVQIDTGGVITLYADVGGAAFTASGTKGVQNTTITYSCD